MSLGVGIRPTGPAQLPQRLVNLHGLNSDLQELLRNLPQELADLLAQIPSDEAIRDHLEGIGSLRHKFPHQYTQITELYAEQILYWLNQNPRIWENTPIFAEKEVISKLQNMARSSGADHNGQPGQKTYEKS